MQSDLRTSDLGDSELSKSVKFTSDSLPQEDSAMAVTSSGEGLGMAGSSRVSSMAPVLAWHASSGSWCLVVLWILNGSVVSASNENMLVGTQ